MNIVLALKVLRNRFKNKSMTNIKAASNGQIKKIMQGLNPKKATESDKISVKSFKTSGSRNRFSSD